MRARGDGAARAAAERGAVRQVVHLLDIVDVVRHLAGPVVVVVVVWWWRWRPRAVVGREAVVTVAAARAKVAAARAKVAAAREGAWARAAVAREHQLLGERVLRAGRDVRVVARLRRRPLARHVGAIGIGHVGLYVRVVGLVARLLSARTPHARGVYDGVPGKTGGGGKRTTEPRSAS